MKCNKKKWTFFLGEATLLVNVYHMSVISSLSYKWALLVP